MTDLRSQLQTALGTTYTLQRELGGGGMSHVFVARDESLGREVVIKVVRPELLEGMSAGRFTREVQLAARLQQANIVPLLTAGDANGTPYYVMPYVRGESMRARVSKGTPVPIAEALGILRDVARALAYAHGEGVVHRDIKPDNILLSGHTAVVTDFGIAKALDAGRTHDGTATQTAMGFSVGTPAYMAPEQAAGDPNVDFRADLYAWGLVAWELLGGKHPFANHTTPQALVTAQMSEIPRSLTELRPDVPVSLANLVMRCLAKDPAMRPASAEEVLAALDQPDMPARQVRPASNVRRSPIIVAGIAAVVAVFAWLATRNRELVAPPDTTASSIQRIAVLPLENQSGDSTQRFYADGMTREIIGVLSEVGVHVLGHRAVVMYAGSTLPPSQIANELKVEALVTGSVQLTGDSVQIRAELLDARTNLPLWSGTVTRATADVMSLQREVVNHIARGINAPLTTEQTQVLGPVRQVNPKAYVQYLLGSEQANLRTPESFPKAIGYLRRAIALDSTFAPSYASYAMANAYGLLYALTPNDSGRAAVEWGAKRAIELDPRLGDAYIARGVARLHIDWDFVGADDDFARGLARQPSTMARGLFMWTRWETGRCDDRTIGGLEISHALIEVEPTTAQWRSDISWCYWAMGDTAAARKQLTAAIKVDPNFYEAFDLFGMVESDAGNIAESKRNHDEAVRLGGKYWVREFSEVVLHMARHDAVSAKRVLASLDKDGRVAQRGFMAYHVGLKDSAYTLLEKAATDHDADLLWVLTGTPYFKAIQKEPRFQALLKRVGLIASTR